MARHFNVLWAVDAVPEHKEIQMKTGQVLKALLNGLDAEVEPVTVFSPDQMGLLEHVFRAHADDHRLEVESTLADWSREAGFSNSRAPRLLVQDEFSISRSTECLRNYAREVGANLIALGTSAKSGFTRAVMGSFAESVALQSETPLFIVSPETRPLTDIREILFPTDFSDSCRQAFNQLLPVAAAKGAHITIFYKLEYVLPHTREAVATYPPNKRYMEQDVAEKHKKGEEWQGIAAKEGISTDIVFNKTTSYVVDSILAAADNMKDGMIAMASQRGKASVVLGSITRELIRRSPEPVWVIHPHLSLS
jgi:nucleotide-binding universal stress UspA family protein